MASLQLPNKANAYVPYEKLVGYLLSETHAVGKSKAKFFRSLGFDETMADDLAQGLLEIAHTGKVKERVESPHGTKYVIEGLLKTPRGTSVRMKTIWIVESGSQAPRFVTAYPAGL
ncbi:MAG: hypothetical protein Kow00123_05010 [Anaerolineales bacterium]